MISKLSRFLLFFCIIYSQVVLAQGQIRTDSLIHILGITFESKAKARLLLKISKEEELRDPGKSLKYAQQAQQVAQRTDFDSAEVRALIMIGSNLNRLNRLKEAIEIGEQIIEKASKNDMQLEVADGRTIMAVAYAQVGDFDNSSKLYFENLKLYEKQNEKKLLGSTLGNIGADFFRQQSYEKALEYINKALMIAKETNNLPLITDQYNNLAGIYQIRDRNLPKALHYYFEALKVARKINDFEQQGINIINIGRLYQEMKRPDSAFLYLNQSLVLFQKVNNPALIADSYIALGNYYYSLKNFTDGKELATKALHIGEEHKMNQTIYWASDLLYNICLKEKDTLEAYKYLVIRTQKIDSLNALQNKKELFKLEFQYNQEKIAKEQKMRQQKNYFLLGFIILGLLSGLFVTILFNSRQKIKIKNTILEKEKAESDLKFKNKELSINLLALLKKNELITEISQKVSAFGNSSTTIDLKKAAVKLNLEIKQSSDDRLWQEFSMRFKEINHEFYDRLMKRHSDLTQSELKLCAYLRLNMSTKEISDLTGQRTETLEMARYRLRKKFGLTNSESNLVAFLSKI